MGGIMSDNDKLLRQAEGLAGFRRLAMIVNAVSYAAWLAGIAMAGAAENRGLWLTMQASGFIVWLVSLMAVLWTIRRARRRRDLGALIDDERTAMLTTRAFQVGYWVLLAPLALLYMASYFVSLDLRSLLLALMALGVAAPSLTYALLYRN